MEWKAQLCDCKSLQGLIVPLCVMTEGPSQFSPPSPIYTQTQVGRYAPKFVGGAHPDPQELLAFLLKGLHEDLNLVLKKPYVDMTVKTEGRDDQVREGVS